MKSRRKKAKMILSGKTCSLFFLLLLAHFSVSQEVNVMDAAGRKQGLWITVEDSATITRKFSNYVDNSLHGELRILVAETEVYRCLYKSGLKDGYESKHLPSGIIQESNVYAHDTIISSMSFYPHGGILTESYYINGLKNGSSKKYYPNGKVRRITTFENGKENGTEMYFWKNGKVMKILKYKDGVITDSW